MIFDELHSFGLDATESALLSADIQEWRHLNPGWEEWALDVRLTRFGLWLAARYADTPERRRQAAEDRERARRELLLD